MSGVLLVTVHVVSEAGMESSVDGLAANGYGLVGGIGQHENTWRIAHVRGPEGVVVSLTERID